MGIEDNSRTIVKKNKDLAGLRQEQSVHDKALKSARADQAKVRTTVMQKEKKIKRAEKALDSKVSLNLKWTRTFSFCMQKPELVSMPNRGSACTFDAKT
jgi:hypothetical protein